MPRVNDPRNRDYVVSRDGLFTRVGKYFGFNKESGRKIVIGVITIILLATWLIGVGVKNKMRQKEVREHIESGNVTKYERVVYDDETSEVIPASEIDKGPSK